MGVTASRVLLSSSTKLNTLRASERLLFRNQRRMEYVRYPVDEPNTLFAGPYELLGCRFGYKSRKGLSVYVDLKNLTNRIHAATVEPVGNAQLEGSSSFNPGNWRA